MSWPLLLASYPRPILQDRLPLLILALLERGGLLTEDRLIEQSGVAEKEVRKALFDLNLNDIIEYGSHHVRLTDRGRELVSRFRFDEDVANSVVDLIGLEEEQREPFRLALGAYRRTAYNHYLNSLCTAWTWKGLAARALRQEPAAPSEEAVAGMRSLLLRDIDQWWRQVRLSRSTKSFSPSVRAGCDRLSYILKLWEDRDDTAGELMRLSRLAQAPKLEQPGGTEPEVGALESPILLLFVSFSTFRSKSEPNRWFDLWNELEAELPERHGRQRVLSYTRQLNRLLADYSKSLGEGSIYSIEPSTQLTGSQASGDDFLTQLLMAESREDLEARTGLSGATLVALLHEIADKAHTLLGEERNLRNQ